MVSLLACLSSGKGTWGQVAKTMDHDWDCIFLVMNPFAAEKFTHTKKFFSIIIDESKPLPDLVATIKNQLDGKLTELEIGLNLISGNGKEHMAVMMAAMELGLGFRWVYAAQDGIKIC